MASDNDMDLTNLNSTQSDLSEIELLRSELNNEEIMAMELESKIKKSKTSDLKSKYDMMVTEIDQLSLKLDNLKWKYSDESEMDERNELLELQKKNEELVENSEETIKTLEEKLSVLKISKQPEPECSKLNISDCHDLIEENNDLKIKFATSRKRLDDLETQKIELNNCISSLNAEAVELTMSQKKLKQASANSFEAFEEKMMQKSLFLSMNGFEPRSDLNGKNSLFDDVKNSYKLISDKYKRLKDEYVKLKEMLANKNAEIKHLTAEHINKKRIYDNFNNEKCNAVQELIANQNERIKDLKKTTDKLLLLNKDLKGKKPQEINNSNLLEIQRFGLKLEEEERKIQAELKNAISSKITLQLKFSKCDRELQSHMKQLSTIRNANVTLKTELKQFKDLLENRETGMENRETGMENRETPQDVNSKKSVRFSHQIDEFKDN